MMVVLARSPTALVLLLRIPALRAGFVRSITRAVVEAEAAAIPPRQE